jgi:outer membrane immunogenic protein
MEFRTGIFGLSLTGVLALAALPANAADLSTGGYKDGAAVPVAAWSGFYAGVNAGGGWTGDQLAYSPTVFTGVTPGGWFGGGQIGYNWQVIPQYGPFIGYGSLVLGIETDLQGAGFSDSARDTGDYFKSQLDYFGTVRGRIGYATDRSLYYVTGGLAYGGLQNEADIAGLGKFNIDTTAVGYALGGGIELKTGHSWSLKAEYQYINLGSNDPVSQVHGSYSANGGKVSDDDFHTIRVGLNYFVGPSYEPLK